MRLFESIIDANHRAVGGDLSAGIHVADFADELPLVALTCIDPRLNRLFPGALGLPDEQFIWLRNAGNIITSSLSSTMRSIALAYTVKGGREVAVIGHTDCQVRKVSVAELTERFRVRGVDRNHLPANMMEYFGLFATEQQNVLRGVEFIRQSPLFGNNFIVHGLMVDVNTGYLDWISNGYEAARQQNPPAPLDFPQLGAATGDFAAPGPAFNIGEMKMPDTQIGESQPAKFEPSANTSAPPPIPPTARRPIPVPPPIRIRDRGTDR